MEEEISVQIDCTQGEYNDEKYIENDNCYLAEALKNAGYKDIFVSSYGSTRIGAIDYEPIGEFDCEVVEKAFEEKSILNVVLKRV